jgi:ComF family protein
MPKNVILLSMLISLIENIIYNNKCKTCGSIFFYKNQNLFCENCLYNFKKVNITYCKSCGKKTSNCTDCSTETKFNEINIFTTYSLILREIINYYKFKGYKNLAKVIADTIKQDFTNFIHEKNINFILYVPSSKKKEKERGFNHLKEILINLVPESLIRDDLIKVKETRLQVDLNKKERMENLKGAFELLNKPLYKEKNILIFDDIITTGSTMLECFYTVRQASPKGIYGYIVAC